MKMRCRCGQMIDLARNEYDKDYRRSCPSCMRSFQVMVRQMLESPDINESELKNWTNGNGRIQPEIQSRK